jgi:hypothetical protein
MLFDFLNCNCEPCIEGDVIDPAFPDAADEVGVGDDERE